MPWLCIMQKQETSWLPISLGLLVKGAVHWLSQGSCVSLWDNGLSGLSGEQRAASSMTTAGLQGSAHTVQGEMHLTHG